MVGKFLVEFAHYVQTMTDLCNTENELYSDLGCNIPVANNAPSPFLCLENACIPCFQTSVCIKIHGGLIKTQTGGPCPQSS